MSCSRLSFTSALRTIQGVRSRAGSTRKKKLRPKHSRTVATKGTDAEDALGYEGRDAAPAEGALDGRGRYEAAENEEELHGALGVQQQGERAFEDLPAQVHRHRDRIAGVPKHDDQGREPAQSVESFMASPRHPARLATAARRSSRRSLTRLAHPAPRPAPPGVSNTRPVTRRPPARLRAPHDRVVYSSCPAFANGRVPPPCSASNSREVHDARRCQRDRGSQRSAHR